MNRVLKFKQTEDSKVYVTSDTHWNHNPKWPIPLWQARGYSSLEESNEHIISEINAKVRPTDNLIHLGDVTLNCSESQYESFLSRINCQNIYLLWGNHNSPSWQIYQREVNNRISQYEDRGGLCMDNDIEIYPFRYRNVVFIGNYAEMTVDGKYFILGHYPIYVFNYMKDEAVHLCGHSHYNLPLSQATNLESKILDVGWDGKLSPWTIEEILEVTKHKKTLRVDHHAKGM